MASSHISLYGLISALCIILREDLISLLEHKHNGLFKRHPFSAGIMPMTTVLFL